MPSTRRRLLVAALTLAVSAFAAPLAHADEARTGLKAEYFDYTDLTGEVAERLDQTIDFDWDSTEPVPGVGDTFSVRWTGVVTAEHDETYTFITKTDDGVRLWVDGELLVDDWNMHAASEKSGQVELEAGQPVDIRMEYFDGVKHALAKLYWRSASVDRQIVPASALAPEAPGDVVSVDIPKIGGVPAVVQPAGSGAGADAGEGPSLLPLPTGDIPAGAPAVVSYGGPLDPPATPIAGETFNAAPIGDVLVRRPADGQLIPLEQGASLPIGTHVDTREGAVVVQTAPAEQVDLASQHAQFEGGMFEVGQPKRGGKVVTIDLLHGEFAEVCGKRDLRKSSRRRGVLARAAGVGARAAGRQRVLRRLWGKGKGRFRTRGRHAAATVRGTEWSIADRCDETSVRVHEGVVDVENLLTGAVVTLRAGDRYAARG
ncbi:MAG TPA: PA14 domain-containing protein [Solirubrobacteraceae bacterium]